MLYCFGISPIKKLSFYSLFRFGISPIMKFSLNNNTVLGSAQLRKYCFGISPIMKFYLSINSLGISRGNIPGHGKTRQYTITR